MRASKREEIGIQRRLERFVVPLLVNGAIAAIYFCTGKLGLTLAFLNESATAVWPPTGISLAALLLLGNRVWPGIWLGAFLVNVTTSGSILAAVGIATGNTIEPVLGAWLVKRFAGGNKAFQQAGSTLRFVLLAAILSTTISATFGVVSLTLAGPVLWSQFSPVWTTWWLGDMVSAIVLTPLLVIWASWPPRQQSTRRWVETISLSIVLVLVGLLVFGGLVGAPFDRYPLMFLCFPPLLWAAFRFGSRGAVTTAFGLSAVAIWGTLGGYGPFVLSQPNESLLLLQAFMGTITVTNLVLGAVVTERENAVSSLLKLEHERHARFTELQATERQLASNLAVARTLAESPAAGEALANVLKVVCESLRWEFGAIWVPDAEGAALRCVRVWHHPSAAVERFKAITHERTFLPGVGLPGRVWRSRQPAWIPDVTTDDNFPRASYAVRDGLHGAFGFPLLAGEKFLGVMEFFSHEVREPDEALLAMFAGIGSQIGQFLERQRAEEALRESEARKTGILESALDCIITMDAEGRIVDFNPAAERVFGYSRDEVIGRTVAETIVPPPLRAAHRNGLARFHATGQERVLGRRIELSALRADGSEIPVELAITATRSGDHPVFFTAYVRDITERKRIEKERERLLESERAARTQAEQAGRLKDDFLATVSHELRTPLNGILGWVQLLKRTRRDEASLLEGLDTIERSGRMQAQLISDLLDMNRIMSGKLRLDVQATELAPLIEAALDTIRPSARAKNIHLEKALAPQSGPIRGDPTRLQQVLENLLSNAIKFTPRDGSVRVQLECSTSHAEISVTDTGMGIKPDFLPHVFEKFRQADASSTRQHGGLGLGLAIVKQIVEMHGGVVGVLSEGENKGARFHVRLPLSVGNRESESEPSLSADVMHEIRLPGVRVLVVDDDPVSREVLRQILGDREAEVETVGSGPEALQRISQTYPDVLLCDIGMPVMDGIEVIRRLRSNGISLPAIAVTAFAGAEDRTLALQAGFDMHLCKPLEANELFIAIETVLRRAAGVTPHT